MSLLGRRFHRDLIKRLGDRLSIQVVSEFSCQGNKQQTQGQPLCLSRAGAAPVRRALKPWTIKPAVEVSRHFRSCDLLTNLWSGPSSYQIDWN